MQDDIAAKVMRDTRRCADFIMVVIVAMTLMFVSACSHIATEKFVIDATNATSSTILVRIAGKDQMPNLEPSEGHRYEALVPCTGNDSYQSISGPNPCSQCFTVVAVKISSRSVSTEYNKCINQNQIFSVVFRESDF